ncbi:MAG: hypothetical protein QHH25_05930, partial [Candidatus Acetothermia bacterium]|nr:hypothetical protein [Candidatus Acetothermia bacterium]
MEPHSFLSRPLDSLEGYQRYRAGAFVRFIEERYGTSVIKETWDRLRANQPPLEAIDNALHKAGASLSEVYFDFAVQYTYARESRWLQQVMGLERDRLETAAVVLKAATAGRTETIRGDHLSGSAFRIVPGEGARGTLNLGFDWSRGDGAWRVRLFIEKEDGDITSVGIAPSTQEYELAGFGEDVKGVAVVVANTSLTRDNTSLQSKYQVVIPGLELLYSISGRVTADGKGLADVTVTLSGAKSATTTTDSSEVDPWSWTDFGLWLGRWQPPAVTPA